MTQPPGGQPPPQGGGFGAPYDPPPGPPQAPSPHPAYGAPSQTPGPYAGQPGPYAPQQPGPYTTRPGYGGTPPPHPPAGPGGRRFRGRTGLVVGAVLAVLLLAGGGVLLFAGGDGGDGRKPVAGKSATPTANPEPDGKDGDRAPGPTAAELNAGREPGEARVLWLKYNDVDLPGKGAVAYGPWTAGDIVARGMQRTVSGYALADGTEKWELSLPTDICAAPTLPTEDGKIVIATVVSNTAEIPDCSVLQVIDLKTGKPGWKKTVPENARLDMHDEVSLSVNGDTVTYARAGGGAEGYRIGDGTKLFGERPGQCGADEVVSGPRLIAGVTCSDAIGKNRIQELDPVTGKPKWTHELEPGWFLGAVYSTDPVVAVVTNVEEERIIALRDDGTLRSRIDGPVAAEAAADAGTLYLPTKLVYADSRVTNTIAAYDLDTGKRTWESDSPAGQAMKPLRVEGGKVLVHVLASKEQGGAIATLAPGGGEPRILMRHPASAADAEDDMLSARALYVDGRTVLTESLLGAGSDEDEARIKTMMVFGE